MDTFILIDSFSTINSKGSPFILFLQSDVKYPWLAWGGVSCKSLQLCAWGLFFQVSVPRIWTRGTLPVVTIGRTNRASPTRRRTFVPWNVSHARIMPPAEATWEKSSTSIHNSESGRGILPGRHRDATPVTVVWGERKGQPENHCFPFIHNENKTMHSKIS